MIFYAVVVCLSVLLSATSLGSDLFEISVPIHIFGIGEARYW